jgi:hypothetical protein
MGSIVRDVIRSVIPDARQRQALSSAEKAYFKTFDDQSEEELPPQMAAFYGNESLGHVARAALTGYGEQGDVIFLTVPIFIRRIEGDPRMSYEITPLLEEQKLALSKVFSKAIK